MQKFQYKFDHYRLPSKNILTVASLLNYDEMTYSIGYAVCYTKKDQYVRKLGNRLAIRRLQSKEIKVILHDWLTPDQLKHHYLANLAIQAVLADMVRTQYENENTGQRVEFAKSTIKEVRQLLGSLDERIVEIESGVAPKYRKSKDADFDDLSDDFDVDDEIGVGISAVCSDEAIVYDHCGRFVPIFKTDVRRVALRLLRLSSHLNHDFAVIDPFNLPGG